jgi:hypothetical protein
MYSYVKALCLARTIGAQWKETDISNIIVYDIFSTYTKVYLELSNPVLTTNVYVDMDTLRIQYSSYNDTLVNLLILIDNATLDTVTELPSTLVRFAKYSDAIRSEYKVSVSKVGVASPENYPEDELIDLELTRPKYQTDMSLIHSHCLVSVNGFYHRTDSDGTKAYVYDGTKSLKKCKQNHLGIMSFLDIGKLTSHRLSKDNVKPLELNGTLKEKVYFSIDGEEDILDNKSYILVLGGYLVFPEDGVFWRNGQKSFALDLNKLPYVERLYESSLYLDQSELELTTHIINQSGLNMDEVWSDAVIKNYFTMSQSFLVTVDVPYMVTKKIHIRHSSLPGMFTTYTDPVYPLFVNYGRAAEYWKTKEDGHWSVTVSDSYLRNYVLSEQAPSLLVNTTDQLVPNKPFHHSRGYLLEISGYR